MNEKIEGMKTQYNLPNTMGFLGVGAGIGMIAGACYLQCNIHCTVEGQDC